MTAEEIDTIEAGRPLDEKIAVHIFGWEQRYARTISGEDTPVANSPEYLFPPGSHSIHDPEQVPHYSTTWDGAGLVIDHLHRQGWVLKMYLTQDDYWLNECIVTKPEWRDDLGIYARDKNLFVAVCRAALKAVLQGK